MSSAAEARFRVQAPNSQPRSIAVIALDRGSDPVIRRMADAGWCYTAFFTIEQRIDSIALSDMNGTATSIAEVVDSSDLVVLAAAPGGHADAAASIGEACSEKRVMTTGLIVGAGSASEQELSKSLAQLRPWSLMVVIGKNDDYIPDLMTALRA